MEAHGLHILSTAWVHAQQHSRLHRRRLATSLAPQPLLLLPGSPPTSIRQDPSCQRPWQRHLAAEAAAAAAVAASVLSALKALAWQGLEESVKPVRTLCSMA
jgi:hypothetical protein